MSFPFYTLNAFSEKGMKGGNQLGVVLETENFTIEEMQMIAKQLNYSESTFVSNITEHGADVKIFLPNREIPFAGHPTIGTAFLLETIWRRENPPRKEITLNLKMGPTRITFEETDDNSVGICTLDQFHPKLIGEYNDHAYMADLLGIGYEDIVADNTIYLIAPSDLPFMFVQVQSIEVMNQLKPKFEEIKDEFDELGGEPYVFTAEGLDGGDFNARLFAPVSGIIEDPATGSAQAAFALALTKLGLLEYPKNGFISFIVEQGYQMERPSKLHNNCEYINGQLVHTRTGGRNYLVSDGMIFLE